MNQTRNISVKASVLETLQTSLSVKQDGGRYQISHVVWQLARMGTYNEAGDLPLVVRLEGSGDFTELYPAEDRLICPVDTADADLLNSDAFLEALVKCAVFLARSRRYELIKCIVQVSSKAAENVPGQLEDWENLDGLKARWQERLKGLPEGFVKEDQNIVELIEETLKRISVEYVRRRQGRLGEDALWGRELAAVKVLEEAGIAGSDLGNALANLAGHGSGQLANRKKAGILFSRVDAMLMIRDYQRRAKLQRPGVRAVDALLLKQDPVDAQIAPRVPGWTTSVGGKMMPRSAQEAAVKWARLAALKAGRGLLPVFFFTGGDGVGRSVLLKQVAWELYKDGFVTAEIVDLDIAAGEAEALATAAVSLDAPLVLIWDDVQGPGLDPVHSIKEFAESQLSGVPMMILAAAPDVGYLPKKIRQISRTSFEEFEVHVPTFDEIQRLTQGDDICTDPASAPVDENAIEVTVETNNATETTSEATSEATSETTSEATPETTPDATPETVATETVSAAVEPVAETVTEDVVEEVIEEVVEEIIEEVVVGSDIEQLQKQRTEELTVDVTKLSVETEESYLETVLKVCHELTVDQLAARLNADAETVLGKDNAVFNLIRSLGSVGLPVPMKLAQSVCGADIVAAFQAAYSNCAEPVFHLRQMNDDIWWDCGHAVLAQSMLKESGVSQDVITGILNNSLECMINDQALQPLAARLIRSIHHSSVISSDTVEILTATLIDRLGRPESNVSPVFLSNLFQLAFTLDHETFLQAVVDALAIYARKCEMDSYVAVTPLLRNRMGAIEDKETLAILQAARPDSDRPAFRFLLKFLSDHLPNDLRETAVDNARTAAAREPDGGFAVAAYLRLCWARGTEEQITRSIEETESWLSATPEDRVVRRAFIEYVVSDGSPELKAKMVEPLEDWLREHMDEGPLRNSLIELVYTLNDPSVSDRVLAETADWIDKRGNNRSVRQNYFRRAEKRNDKSTMRRACKVAVSWLNNHPDDRETVRSLMFLASRVGEAATTVPALSAIYRWLNSHVIERDILRRYLILSDRTGRGRAVSHAVEMGLAWIVENVDDSEIREILLGLAARRVDRKVQVRVYDANAMWLSKQEAPDPMVEYLVGRLGVRAGIARRAIPLLERAASRAESELSGHAKLWLGSAYRVAEAYEAAIKVWEEVKAGSDVEMSGRAERNLQSLNDFLKEKFPKGFPPPEAPRPRRRPQQEDGDRQEQRSSGPRRDGAGADRRDDRRGGSPQDGRRRDGDRGGDRGRRDGRSAPPRRQKGGQHRKPQTAAMGSSKGGATLGDLMKLKGLNLKSLTESDDDKKKKK